MGWHNHPGTILQALRTAYNERSSQMETLSTILFLIIISTATLFCMATSYILYSSAIYSLRNSALPRKVKTIHLIAFGLGWILCSAAAIYLMFGPILNIFTNH